MGSSESFTFFSLTTTIPPLVILSPSVGLGNEESINKSLPFSGNSYPGLPYLKK